MICISKLTKCQLVDYVNSVCNKLGKGLYSKSRLMRFKRFDLIVLAYNYRDLLMNGGSYNL